MRFLELCRAEWMKIVGHRWAFLLLLAIFPLTSAVVFLVLSAVAALDPSFRADSSVVGDWTRLMLMGWKIPSDPMGRIFLVALTAFLFAGEYQWGTWKNITPRRRRSTLVLAKLLVLAVLVVVTFTITSFVLALGGGLLSLAMGTPYSPALDGGAIGAFLPQYALAVLVTFLAFAVTAALTVLAALYSKSILGGAMVGVVMMFFDPVMTLIPRALSSLFGMPAVAHLSRLVPYYNIENLDSWATTGGPTRFMGRIFTPIGLPTPSDGVAFSVTVLLAWVVVALGVALVVFARQDIDT